MAERYTGRKFIEQTLTSYTDQRGRISGDFTPGWTRGSISDLLTGGGCIEFDWSPAVSITSVVTIDSSNSETAYAATNYYLDNYDNDKPAKMQFNDSAALPPDLRDENAWKIVWKAGYGTASTDVPASIRRAIIMLAGHLYENRGDCEGELCGVTGAYAMLNPFKIIRG